MLALPSKACLVRTSNRARQKLKILPEPNPICRNFEIPEQFQNFLQSDSGPENPERILIFGDSISSNLLNFNTTWLAYGTFKLSPDMFYHLYTVHVNFQGFTPPCIYALLPNKTYSKVMQIIKILCPQLSMQNVVGFWKCRNERNRESVPSAEISVFHFHLCHNVLRKVNELWLKRTYESHPEFALAAKPLPALAFIIETHVKGTFEIVVQEQFEISYSIDETVYDRTDELCSYFKNTYIENCTSLTRPPLFSIKMWNQHNAAQEGLARTNNAVEGWHYGIQTFLTGSSPSAWALLENLKKDAKVNVLNYYRGFQGDTVYSRKKYRKLNESKKHHENIQRRKPHFFSCAH